MFFLIFCKKIKKKTPLSRPPYLRPMLPRPPLVTIITVVFNAKKLLEDTARTVLAQTYPHIEYLIVDGGSTDGTVEVIRLAEKVNGEMFNSKILRWVSEPDKGLYDAMNKGLRMATGDFVWFLNAGDHLFTNDTVEKAMARCTPSTDVLYGEVMHVNFARRHLGIRSERLPQKLPESLTWKSLRRGMVVCHQGFIARRNLAPPFIPGSIAADIDWVIEILKKSREVVHTHLIMAEYLEGGISKQRFKQGMIDRYFVLEKHFGKWQNRWNHVLIAWRAVAGVFK